MDKKLLLSQIEKNIHDCKKCILWKGTTNPVPGEGNPDSEVVFIGEGPGFNEDKQGRPFVGQAGKLLDKLLTSIGISREEVFIANVIKHRPPENRDPLPSEILACKYWLDQQMEIIKPKVVVTLGRYSMARYMPNVKISEVHGNPIKIKGLVVIPMYHPAAALRRGIVMDSIEKDFQRNKEILKNPTSALNTEGLKNENEDPNQMNFF